MITAEESLEQPTSLREIIAQNQKFITSVLEDHTARIDKLERAVAHLALGQSAVAEQAIQQMKQMPLGLDKILDTYQRPYHELTPEAILHSEERDPQRPAVRDEPPRSQIIEVPEVQPD